VLKRNAPTKKKEKKKGEKKRTGEKWETHCQLPFSVTSGFSLLNVRGAAAAQAASARSTTDRLMVARIVFKG
jgi:hypothetical protein